MGCIKSKAAFQGSNTVQDERVGAGGSGCAGEKSSLLAVKAEERGPSSTLVLDYAQRLSRDILEQAVRQWAVTESKYSDIPFIESDVP
ncbi:small membrane A-kinase anchor protein [Oenanthe melanoleuca]|uniref:small membrane A-kinase anchor protein n=1 Tax=Oenanthe melanoleuca TaxID=2939378 RepID=UPI0024C1F160|nr:small membrane A-kinase anchor protein [Oenanthe melanoleuca]XP_056351908.1 small membrane A-kinase anchor protein [Oenanthe melanoleuca]XP_056351909.1 small membrane A-kinase anchor protein [Oenanthe melanoleuca]